MANSAHCSVHKLSGLYELKTLNGTTENRRTHILNTAYWNYVQSWISPLWALLSGNLENSSLASDWKNTAVFELLNKCASVAEWSTSATFCIIYSDIFFLLNFQMPQI